MVPITVQSLYIPHSYINEFNHEQPCGYWVLGQPRVSSMGASQSSYTQPAAVATKWFPTFETELPDATGKVAAVTGTTSGTGMICARTLAKKGATVYLLNRKSPRADAAEQKMKEEIPDAAGRIETIECDLQSFASTKAAAAILKAKCAGTGLDILCCNAGVMALKDQATEDGYDIQMQTNHLSHFLLAKETFPLLELAARRTGDARIVSHSSGARHKPNVPITGNAKYLEKNGGNLGGDGSSMFFGGARWVRYHMTKLANSVFTQALHERLSASGSKVKAVCAAPGLATTQLQVTTAGDNGMGSGAWFMRFGQSAEDGTMPLLHACLGEGVASGEFYEPTLMGNMKGPHGKVKLGSMEKDPAAMKTLWEASEKACGSWPGSELM